MRTGGRSFLQRRPEIGTSFRGAASPQDHSRSGAPLIYRGTSGKALSSSRTQGWAAPWTMNRSEILALFDRQMRSDPAPEPGVEIERVGRIVRAIGPEDCILFSDLGTDRIEPAILEQVSHFRSSGRPLEWKVYSHDRPPELRGRLIEHGFVPDETESLMIEDSRCPIGRAGGDIRVGDPSRDRSGGSAGGRGGQFQGLWQGRISNGCSSSKVG